MAGLYIHVPFCHARCAYCDFYSLPGINRFAPLYAAAIQREWTLRRAEVGDIKTIYLGGGTPSSLPANVLKSFAEWLPVNEYVQEFTIEINPEDVNIDNIRLWKGLGVNRVSMGVQSLNDKELQIIGRRHTAEEAIKALELLDRNFDNISVDIIMGLPGQTVQSLENTVTQLLKYRPEHFSAYILSYEEGTRLWSLRRMGKITEADDVLIENMYLDVCALFRAEGYEHYEISNFALPEKKAVHNSSYWNNVPYLGLGPGAHSFDGTIRRANPADIKSWLNSLNEGKVTFTVETETDRERINNLLMTRLRTADGLDLNMVPNEFMPDLKHNIASLPFGRIVKTESRISIGEKQWLLSDDTISRLFV